MQIGLFDGRKQFKLNKPIRLIELFGGIGCQAKALENLNIEFEHYRMCDFDKYAVQSYNAVHGTNFVPSDITKITAEDLAIVETDKYDYIMTYSFPCFTADSLVLTQNGYRNIDEIIVGDKVLTHTNNYENVTKVFNNGISDIYSIRGMGIDEIKATINHKFYVREMYRKGHFNIRTFTEPKWKEVKDLTKKDYLGIAINQNSIVPNWNGIGFKWSDGRKTRYKNQLSELMGIKDFWWIIGRYIGDGWIRSQGGIIICCAKSETKDVISRVSKFFNYSISEERTVNKIHISLKELELFVSQFERGAKNKCLTNTIIDLPINLLKEFLDGYWSADGCFTNGVFKASSVSRKLIYGMAQCVAKVYKTPYRIYENIRKPKRIIEGRSVNQNTSYELVFKKDKRKQDKAFYEDGYIWFPIKSIQYVGKENVYDIEVEKDHSFTVQNTMVHNCTDLSKAGKCAGMQKGSGTRSGLLWEVERLLDECEELPQVLLMENVPDVIGTKNMPHFADWIAKLEVLGYKNYWKILNATGFGIPQNRKRCFMVSLLGDYYYNFPEPTKLELRLKDMLEDEVDEKYYLSDKALKGIVNTSFQQGKIESRTEKDGIIPTLNARYYKDPKLVQVAQLDGFESSGRVYSENGLAPTINTMGGGNRQPKIAALRGRNPLNPSSIKAGEHTEQRLEIGGTISNTLTTVQKDNLVIEPICLNSKVDGKQPSVQDRIYDTGGVSTAITTGFMPSIAEPINTMGGGNREPKIAIKNVKNLRNEDDIFSTLGTNCGSSTSAGGGVVLVKENLKTQLSLDTRCDCLGVVVNEEIPYFWNYNESKDFQKKPLENMARTLKAEKHDDAIIIKRRIRKLTPKECWRLMGLSDTDFDKAKASGVSNSQLYKQAGNGIVVNVLMAIFKNLLKE